MGQRAAAAHRGDRRRHRRRQDRCTPRRSTTTRRSPSSRPAASSRAGRASGAWLSYGLGSENENLPAFVVHDLAGHAATRPISRSSRGCGAAASCPSSIRASASAPAAIRCSTSPIRPASTRDDAAARCSTASAQLNELQHEAFGDPEIDTRIAQYEMAFRMQTSVPELTDLSERAASTSSRCTAPKRASRGSFAAQLPARPPAGRARRALRPALSPRLGPARQPAARHRAASAATPTSRPPRSSRTSSSAACSTTRSSSGAASSAARSTARASSTDDNYGRDHHGRCFTHLDGRRRHQARASTLRRDRRLLLQRRRGPRPRPRPATRRSCTAWASITRGSPTASRAATSA